jgi:outer membrane protein assembly factor BamB
MNRRSLLAASARASLGLALGGAVSAAADDWPQWRGANRDGVWTEQGLLEKFPGPELTPVWRVPVSNGYTGPTVAKGRVFLTDRVTEPQQQERIHCIEEKTGRTLWIHSYDAAYGGVGYPDGPRAAVTVHDGLAYALGAIGHLNCMNVATGRLVWSKDLNAEYKIRLPIWGITAAPLIEGDLVILHIGGEGEACFVALDRKTGAERWKSIGDRPAYVAPVIVRQAGQRVMVCVTGDRVVGLDPRTGKLHWSHPFPARNMPIAVPTPVVRRDEVFVTSFYEGSLLLRLDPKRLAVEKVWRRSGQNEQNTDALHSIISTPLFLGDHIYGVDSYGELRCLDARTGDRLWTNTDAVPRARWATIHFVQNGDRTWMFNERGQLIIARLTPKGYEEISRTQLLQPTRGQLNQRGGVCWSHPAYANRHVFARNDQELVCANLAAR